MTKRVLTATTTFAISFAVVGVPAVLAGHGYDTGSPQRRDTGGSVDDGGGGIGLVPILIVAGLVVAAVVVTVALEPPADRARLRRLTPILLLAALIATPLVVWTATSGGDAKPLVVQRGQALTGKPELLVSLTDRSMNTLAATNGRRSVRIHCVGRDGRVVIEGRQKWPFVRERGFEFAHAHQLASRSQVQRADRCRVLGTRTRLEADVEGSLSG